MRWLSPFLLVLVLCLAALRAPALDFKLTDGTVINGELVAPNDEGAVIRRSGGGLTTRYSWDRFSQATLHEIAKEPKLKEWVEAFIDAPEGANDKVAPELVIKQPAGLIDRPAKRPGLFSALSTPAGLFLLGLIFLANLYAAYEVSVFRNYPVPAVLLTSVILPVLGPVLFLCMPTRVREDVMLESQFEAPVEVQNTGAQELAAAGLAGSGLSLAASKAPAAAATSASMGPFKRGDVEFNRQFFERSFPQLFRLTRSEGDKDNVLSVRTGKGEVVAVRISRISSNEIGLITQKGHEVQVKFAEISEVAVRGKA